MVSISQHWRVLKLYWLGMKGSLDEIQQARSYRFKGF